MTRCCSNIFHACFKLTQKCTKILVLFEISVVVFSGTMHELKDKISQVTRGLILIRCW